MIQAEAHSDDRAVEVEFDAEPWLKQASDQEIIKLCQCGFGGDYPADQVAIKSADWNEDLAKMFAYIEARGNIETIGFECHVDEHDVRRWMSLNRPRVHMPVEE